MKPISFIILLFFLATPLFAFDFSEGDSTKIIVPELDSTKVVTTDSLLQEETVPTLSPDTIAARIATARRLMKEYRFDSAIDTLEKTYSRDSSSIELAKELEEIYYSTSENTKALEFINLLLEQGIDSAVYLPRKAMAMKKEGNLPESLIIFSQLIDQDTTNTFFLNQMGDIFKITLRADSALIYYTKSAEVSPKSVTIFKAGQLFLDLDEPAEALSFFEKYYNPEIHDSKPLRRLYGQTFFLLNEYEKSIEIFDELYQKGDSSFITTKFLGMSYRKNGEYLEAEKPLKQAAFLNPNDYLVYYNLGICTRNIGMTEQSEKHFHTAMEIVTTPQLIKDMINTELAETYKRAGKWDKTLELYNILLKHDPKNLAIRMDRLMILDHYAKDKDLAIKSYKETVDILEKDTAKIQHRERMIKYLNQRIDKLEEQKFWDEKDNN
jgi:tetratricopeptide (TPR) repeat protein